MTHAIADGPSVSSSTTHPGEKLVAGIKVSILGALILDGFLCAVLAVLFLPLYVGPVQAPVSAILAGAVNVLLIRVAYSVSHTVFRASLPLLAFFAGLLVCMMGGPGGDVLLAADWRVLLLLAGGLLPPVAQLFAIRLSD